jgi:hypothetical protein
MTTRKLDVYVGQVFYELTVISNAPIYKSKRAHILCKCSCGNIKEIRKDYLFDKVESKRCKSCGCKKNNNRKFKKRREGSMYSTLYRNCKSSAKNRKIEFSLLKEDHIKLVKENCFYCGSSPKLGQRIGKNAVLVGIPVYYNGIDRINSNDGYSKENCVSCCELCNKMKIDFSIDNFMEKVLKIHKHQKISK